MSGVLRARPGRLAVIRDRLYPGELVALVVIPLSLLFILVSATTAPPVAVTRTDPGSETLVGMQGLFMGHTGT